MKTATRSRREFLIGLLIGSLLVPALAAPAWAHPSTACYSTDQYAGIWNTEGTNTAQQGNHTGIKSSLHVASWGGYSGNGDCIRVSSIGVLSGAGNGFVEVGWYLGWDNDANNQYTGLGACVDGTYHAVPEVFVAWWPDGGGYHCKNLSTEAEDVFRNFQIEDSNQNMVFKYYEGGTQLGTLTVNFSRGTCSTNGEGHNAQVDSAAAHFKNLQNYIAGSTTLYSFAGSRELPMGSQDDPDYYWSRVSDVETKVVRN